MIAALLKSPKEEQTEGQELPPPRGYQMPPITMSELVVSFAQHYKTTSSPYLSPQKNIGNFTNDVILLQIDMQLSDSPHGMGRCGSSALEVFCMMIPKDVKRVHFFQGNLTLDMFYTIMHAMRCNRNFEMIWYQYQVYDDAVRLVKIIQEKDTPLAIVTDKQDTLVQDAAPVN